MWWIVGFLVLWLVTGEWLSSALIVGFAWYVWRLLDGDSVEPLGEVDSGDIGGPD